MYIFNYKEGNSFRTIRYDNVSFVHYPKCQGNCAKLRMCEKCLYLFP